eukprot:Tamp_27546.p3 GENE.Tamp_27546~~Tamp_27546.p3  ORF type:complete len:109 (-),score=10.95 Tamp_27546:248-574(-)
MGSHPPPDDLLNWNSVCGPSSPPVYQRPSLLSPGCHPASAAGVAWVQQGGGSRTARQQGSTGAMPHSKTACQAISMLQRNGQAIRMLQPNPVLCAPAQACALAYTIAY